MKLQFDILLSNFALKFNLRRYKVAAAARDLSFYMTLMSINIVLYVVRRCRLTLSNPR